MQGHRASTGIQLCALIEPIKAVKNLGGKDKPLGDLMLIVAYDPDGKLSIVINLPENFGVGAFPSLRNHGTNLPTVLAALTFVTPGRSRESESQ